MLHRVLAASLVAGGVAGAVATLAQMLGVVPLIHLAETFELGTAAESADDGRLALTLLANLVIGVGFSLLLAAAFVLRGRRVGLRQGFLWGLAGFAIFSLAPAMGLPPELPGAAAGPLDERQAWWLATVVATAGGLGLMVFPRRLAWKFAGAGLVLLPHFLGAPHAAGEGAAPAELQTRFVVLSLVGSGLFWAVLGSVEGYLYDRWAVRVRT